MAYMVMSLGKNVSVELEGREHAIPLSWAEGMMGAMPIFETREQADAYSNGLFEIAEVRVLQPNDQVQP